MTSRTALGSLSLLPLLLALGCGAGKSDDDPGFTNPTADKDASGGSDFDVGSSGSDAADFDLGTGPTDVGPSSSDSSCAGTKSAATIIPLDIFIMQDQSGSMSDTTSTGGTKWDGVKAALDGFMGDPGSAGIGVGIQYFGLKGGSGGIFGSGTSCTVADYQKPEVEIAPLPGVKASIDTSLAKHSPTGGTPTGPALEGALNHAHEWQVAHPSHVVIVLLATDGLPTLCTPQDIPTISSDAAAAAKAGIRTYVIGVLADGDLSMGADTNLNDISKAGNGGPAFIVKSSTTDVTAAFLDALKKIRGSALACSYEVPMGAGADYKKVNVNVTLGGKDSTIPYVGSAAACDATKGGWYYDVDPSKGTPKKIILCDASCKALQGDSTAKIDIEVGCATIGIK